MGDAVASLRELVPHALSSPSAAYGVFLLASLQQVGVLSESVLPWQPGQEEQLLAAALASGLREARLAVASRLLHVDLDCDAALPELRRVAEEVLAEAEASADHSLPTESTRLRNRHRDGAWLSLRRREADAAALEEELAAQGVAEAQRHIGYRRLVGGRNDQADVGAAADAFEAAAAQGDEIAAFNLGFMALRGLPQGPPDYVRAQRLFDVAAAADLPAAHNGLGVLAFNGWGMEQNFSSARLAFERGAALGDADAHFNLGLILSSGHGVPVDHAAALRCYEAASDAGHWRAPLTLASLHADGVGTERNCSTAARLVQLFLEERLGWADAVEDAAEAAEEGDVQGALAQLAPLAMQGCEAAQSDAAFLLRRRAGWLPLPDALRRAAALLERASLQGSAEATVDLGDVRRAQGNLSAAIAHYRQAAEAGSAEGMVNLALLTAGFGARNVSELPRNLTAARRLLLDAWDASPDDASRAAPAILLVALRAVSAVEALGELDRDAVALSTSVALLAGLWVVRRRLGPAPVAQAERPASPVPVRAEARGETPAAAALDASGD